MRPNLAGRALVAAGIAMSTAILPALASSALSPAVAMADESLEALEREARGIRDQLSAAEGAYIGAVQQQEEATAAMGGAREELESVQSQLDEHQRKLSTLVKAQYTNSVNNARMIHMITSSENFADITETMDYLQEIENKKVTSTNQIRDLRDAHSDAVRNLEETARAAQEAAERAKHDQEAFQTQLNEMRPRINALLGEVKARLNGSAGSAQLEEAMSFLQNIDGITETQEAIVRSAYRTGYSGYGLCENWAERVYRNAGVGIKSHMSAYDAYCDYLVSESQDDIPPGALVYGSGSSAAFSHVGVCVFNGGGGPDSIYVMDNEGSRNGQAVTLTEWLKWQTAVSYNNGRSGWFGWGLPEGVDIR